MRRRYRYDAQTKQLVEIKEAKPQEVAPKVFGDIPGYESPVSGKWVEGRRARREDLKRTGCRPYEGRESEQRAAQQHWKDLEKRQEQSIEKAVHQAWSEASSQTRKILTRY